jgi:crossover junction endodeoxyribonuclease RusA
MRQELRAVLPLPPSVNHLYRNFTKNGRRMRVTTAKARKWFTDAAWILKDAKTPWWETLDEKCVVDLWVWWPDRRARDCDNLNKVILDALTHNGIVTDDHFCLPRWQDYGIDKHNPRVEVHVWKKDGSPTTGETTTSGTGPS